MQQRPHHDIELAKALHEINTARFEHAMQTFLDGPDARNGHVGRAMGTIRAVLERRLRQSLDNLIQTVSAMYDDPQDRETAADNARRADRTSDLRVRFINHMNAHFERSTPYGAKSVFYAMTIMTQANNHVLQVIHDEIVAKEKGDTVAEAYREALLHEADFPHNAGAVLARMEQDGDATDNRMRRHLHAATESERDSRRIRNYHWDIRNNLPNGAAPL